MFNPTFEKFKTKAEEYQNNAATEIYGYFESNKIIGVIVTEESESQIEIITPTFNSIDEAFNVFSLLADLQLIWNPNASLHNE